MHKTLDFIYSKHTDLPKDLFILLIKGCTHMLRELELSTVAHTFNASIWATEAGGHSVNLRLAWWSTQ